MLQEKQQSESDLADAKRSAVKLKQKLVDTRAKNASIEMRMLKMLGQESTSPAAALSAGGDFSGYSSSDDAHCENQQVP